MTAYALTFHVPPSSDPDVVRRILLSAAAAHGAVRRDPPAQVEFVEMGLASLRFQLRVWSSAHLNAAGGLKSDLNFEVWRRLRVEGVSAPTAPVAAVALSTWMA